MLKSLRQVRGISISDDWHGLFQVAEVPEKKLLCAILERATFDLREYRARIPLSRKGRTNPLHMTRQQVADLLRWVFRGGKEDWSLWWICDQLAGPEGDALKLYRKFQTMCSRIINL